MWTNVTTFIASVLNHHKRRETTCNRRPRPRYKAAAAHLVAATARTRRRGRSEPCVDPGCLCRLRYPRLTSSRHPATRLRPPTRLPMRTNHDEAKDNNDEDNGDRDGGAAGFSHEAPYESSHDDHETSHDDQDDGGEAASLPPSAHPIPILPSPRDPILRLPSFSALQPHPTALAEAILDFKFNLAVTGRTPLPNVLPVYVYAPPEQIMSLSSWYSQHHDDDDDDNDTSSSGSDGDGVGAGGSYVHQVFEPKQTTTTSRPRSDAVQDTNHDVRLSGHGRGHDQDTDPDNVRDLIRLRALLLSLELPEYMAALGTELSRKELAALFVWASARELARSLRADEEEEQEEQRSREHNDDSDDDGDSDSNGIGIGIEDMRGSGGVGLTLRVSGSSGGGILKRRADMDTHMYMHTHTHTHTHTGTHADVIRKRMGGNDDDEVGEECEREVTVDLLNKKRVRWGVNTTVTIPAIARPGSVVEDRPRKTGMRSPGMTVAVVEHDLIEFD